MRLSRLPAAGAMLVLMDPRLVEIVETLLEIVRSGPQDLLWQCTYHDEAQLVADLRDHARRLRDGDGSRLTELRFALAPTGALNEIALGSGWADRYAALANRFDENGADGRSGME